MGSKDGDRCFEGNETGLESEGASVDCVVIAQLLQLRGALRCHHRAVGVGWRTCSFRSAGDLEHFRRCGLKRLLWRLTVRKSSYVEELDSSGG